MFLFWDSTPKKQFINSFLWERRCLRFNVLRVRPELNNIWCYWLSKLKVVFLKYNRVKFCHEGLNQQLSTCRMSVCIEVLWVTLSWNNDQVSRNTEEEKLWIDVQTQISPNDLLVFIHQLLTLLLPPLKRQLIKNSSAVWPFQKNFLWHKLVKTVFIQH